MNPTLNQLIVFGKTPAQLSRTAVITPTYSMLTTDQMISVNYAGAVSITLSPANTFGSSAIIKQLYVIDESGNASINNINIQANGADTILGLSTYVMNVDYKSVSLYSNGNNAWFVF